MDIHDLLKSSGQWLSGQGPESHIVMSSRVRLARNIADRRLMPRMNDDDKRQVFAEVHDALGAIPAGKELQWFDIEKLSSMERHFLLERHLISREQEEGSGPRAVSIAPDESVAVMINEEDHLRIQSICSGLQLDEAFSKIDQLDDQLASAIDFAYDDTFGYLTACPTNVGTGMRVSVMLHLPALVMTRHIEKAFRAVHDLRLAVRGLYGEGTEAHGEFYQISNQITVGRSERELIEDLRATIESIIAYENRAREKLMEGDSARVEDRVWRSFGLLKNARIITSEEAMKHLSSVRLGVHLGILPFMEVAALNTMFIYIQPAHLQCIKGHEMPSIERDTLRAMYIRDNFDSSVQ